MPYPKILFLQLYGLKCCRPMKLQESLKCNISEGNDEINFWHADKHCSFLQVDTITLVVIVRRSIMSENKPENIPSIKITYF